MSVTEVHKDPVARTMRITSEFDAPPGRVWEVVSDPRQLERWWGPPGYPTTVLEHSLDPGGRVHYYMTSPEGDRNHGLWQVIDAEPPKRLEFENGFADAEGNPDPATPTSIITIEVGAHPDGGTRMDIVTAFGTDEVMEQMLTLGMDVGMSAALGQIDGILAG